jgi:magnesium chelatase family protein
MDRIDLHVELAAVPIELLQAPSSSEESEQVRCRVLKARQQQIQRGGKLNHELSAEDLEAVCRITNEGKRLLATAMEHFGLSVRAYYRILRLARTIADLQRSSLVRTEDIAEAIQFRKLDRPISPDHHS